MERVAGTNVLFDSERIVGSNIVPRRIPAWVNKRQTVSIIYRRKTRRVESRKKIGLLGQLRLTLFANFTRVLFQALNSAKVAPEFRKGAIDLKPEAQRAIDFFERVRRNSKIWPTTTYAMRAAHRELERFVTRVNSGEWEVPVSKFPWVEIVTLMGVDAVRRLPRYAKVHLATTAVFIGIMIVIASGLAPLMPAGLALRFSFFAFVTVFVIYVLNIDIWFPGLFFNTTKRNQNDVESTEPEL